MSFGEKTFTLMAVNTNEKKHARLTLSEKCLAEMHDF